MWKRAAALAACMGISIAAIGQPGMPPAKVTAASVVAGRLAPTAQFEGTVYYKEVSNLATEVSGKVVEVLFEEGQHLASGKPLVRLDDSLLRSQLRATRASHRESQTRLEQEEVRLERAELLIKDEVTTPQEYDDIKFTMESLEHRAEAARAEVERLELEIAKKVTSAPYDAIVLERRTELGEWKNGGEAVAVVARDRLFDVIVNLPEQYLPFVKMEAPVDVSAGGRTLSGKVVAVIPRGDVATRTFPVKIRIESEDGLLEGMSALVNMPVGKPHECLLVPRDAILLDRGQAFVVIVREGVAVRLPVTLHGYEGVTAGVEVDGLQAGMSVVTKGHERLRDGQPVAVAE